MLAEENHRAQAAVLGAGIVLGTFAIPYVSIRLGFRDSYAARLGVITFGIVANSFLVPNNGEEGWETGMFRAANILLGCVVALISLLLWPQSTKTLIEKKVRAQMTISGDSAAKVLDLAYDSFVNKRSPAHWQSFFVADLPNNNNSEGDSAYEAYTKGMKTWKTCMDMFPMLSYDPLFFVAATKKERDRFKEHMMIRSQRAFRIQINLVMMDSIVRGGVFLDEYKDTFEVLRDVGGRIRTLLDLDEDTEERDRAAKALVDNDLVRVRLYVQRLRDELTRQQRKQIDTVGGGRCINGEDASVVRLRRSLTSFSGERILHLLESREQVALFFQLVEHLIIRATRLHYFCKELQTP